MTQAKFSQPRCALFILLGLGFALLPACGGSEPPAAAPPPPPPPVAAAPTPPPPPPPPAATPAPAAEAPPAAPPKHHGHGMEAMLIASLDSLELKPEQKTAVESIESDLDKLHDAAKEPKAKLEADVADGVAAGKIDHKKTDADITALSTAVAATAPTMQDAMNRLYKTLDADQRKKLVASMREKGKEMREHMAEHDAKGPGMGMGMGGKDHDAKGPMAEGKGPGMGGMGMAGKDHDAKGPAGKDHDHDAKGPLAEGKGPGMGHEHEGMGMGHEHEGMGGMGEGPLMKLGDELSLTPEQKDKLKGKLEAQMKAAHATMKTKMEAVHKHMEAVGTAFEGDKFDAKKAGVGTQAADMVKTMATAKVQFVETVLAVLTPEQRTKFAAHLKEHANDMDES